MNEKDVLYEIRRPRTRTDPPALIQYVVMSGVFSTAEGAWEDAKIKLDA
jgi:hypothetical protein